jgi:ATP-binding cassette subfamily B protein
MKENTTKQAIHMAVRDYLGQYKKHPWLFVGAFVLPALGTILVFFVPPLILARMVDAFTAQGFISLSSALPKIALMAGLWLLGEAFWRIGIHAMNRLIELGCRNLASTAFKRLQSRDYDFYTNHFVGSLTKKASAYFSMFVGFTQVLAFDVVTNLFPVLFAIIVLLKYSLWIPAVLLIAIGIGIVLAVPIIHKRSEYVIARHHASSRLSGRLSDVVTNMFTVKSFSQEAYEARVYDEYVDDFTSKQRKASDFQNLHLDTVMSPMYVITNMLGLSMAILLAQTKGLEVGVLILVFSYFSQVTRIFWTINNVYRGIESSVTEAAEFNEMFIDEPKVQDVPHAREIQARDGSIVFDHVHFSYQNNQGESSESFLQDFNLVIPSKQKVGLVGPSGGGKTTITKLILRFIDIDAGTIRVGGDNIGEVKQSSLRQVVSYVPQEPLLFHRSLYENIAYGKPDATMDSVIEASKLAHAHDFIKDLPHGYDTMVGERGIKLSGGQRQRIAIARAMLKGGEILVLDEATSALDSESEKYIQQGLWELMKDKTALVIAHRLSTIKHLDRILVLDKGVIVEDGTHDELIKKKGLYAKLWGHQSGEFLED